MMSRDKRFVMCLDPGLMTGVSWGDWLAVLQDNRFRLDAPYWPKAVNTSLRCLANTPLRWLETALYHLRLGRQEVREPLFILGHWRSGTTFLHALLAADRRFACPTYAQITQPHCSLLTGRLGSWFLSWTRPPGRGVLDSVPMTTDSPEEEEFALCRLTFLSPYLGWAFPERAAHYDRYLTFRDVPQREVERWQAAFLLFARKLAWKYRRPLIFKSPPHTARIRLLLKLFPDARFLHIRRDPYSVYQSSRRMHLLACRVSGFQRHDPQEWHGRTLRLYKAMYDAFFQDKPLVPAGQFAEVAFEDLEKDPVGQVRRAYEELSLPDFDGARSAVQAHADSVRGHRKNRYDGLPPDLRAEIGREWRSVFEEWNYPL
jgi:hypothetical protein